MHIVCRKSVRGRRIDSQGSQNFLRRFAAHRFLLLAAVPRGTAMQRIVTHAPAKNSTCQAAFTRRRVTPATQQLLLQIEVNRSECNAISTYTLLLYLTLWLPDYLRARVSLSTITLLACWNNVLFLSISYAFTAVSSVFVGILQFQLQIIRVTNIMAVFKCH